MTTSSGRSIPSAILVKAERGRGSRGMAALILSGAGGRAVEAFGEQQQVAPGGALGGGLAQQEARREGGEGRKLQRAVGGPPLQPTPAQGRDRLLAQEDA